MSSLLTCGRPICRPFALAFSIPDRTRLRIISEDALNKVWDSFYRADPARTEAGTGLGLTITKSIVELHRGSCYVRNTTFNAGGRVESGVAFGFTLPMG